MQQKNQRKILRLKSFDYTRSGYYFVTICVQNKECCLGEIKDGTMVPNNFGAIVEKQWVWLKQNFPYVTLDEFVIMPNHFHGILIIQPVGKALEPSLHRQLPLSNIIGAFKTTSSKHIHSAGLTEFSWQKSFYDHIIRQEESLDKIREYIQNNPKQWELDDENPKNSQGRV